MLDRTNRSTENESCATDAWRFVSFALEYFSADNAPPFKYEPTYADTGDFACTDGNAHARPADDDRTVGFALGDLFRSGHSDVWVGRLVGTLVDTDINHALDPRILFQLGLDGLLVIETSLIGADSYCPGWARHCVFL